MFVPEFLHKRLVKSLETRRSRTEQPAGRSAGMQHAPKHDRPAAPFDPTLHPLQEHSCSLGTECFDGLRDRREFRLEDIGPREVVDDGHRHVARAG